MKPGSRSRRLALGGAVAVLSVALLGIAGRTDQSGPAPSGNYPDVDWTPLAMFGGSAGRNLVNASDRNIPTDWDVTPGRERNVRWVADLGSKSHPSPVVAGGKIFVGTNNDRPRNPAIRGDRGTLMCFRERDGSFLWQAVHDMLETGRVNDWPGTGIASAPAVEGRRLYYVSNRCELVCADTEGFRDGWNDGVRDEKYRSRLDADVVWRLDMRQELNVFPHNKANCSPLLVGDLLFVVTSNGMDKDHVTLPHPEAPSFLAVHKRTGRVVWKSAAPGRNILHAQWSNPAYAAVAGVPQVIFPGGDGWLYAFEPRGGQLLWKFDCNPKSARYSLGGGGTKSDFLATPVVWEDKLYVGVGQDPEHRKGVGHLWCIDLVRAVTFGRTNKDHDVSPVHDNLGPRAAVNRRSALAWHYGGPAPADADRDYLFGRTLSTCAVHEGLCYAAEYEGILHCLDARTGKPYWEHDMGADTWSSPYWVGGHVYLGNEKGTICVFQHGKEKRLVREIDMLKGLRVKSGKVRATPVAANGVLYVVTENPCRLWAIAGR